MTISVIDAALHPQIPKLIQYPIKTAAAIAVEIVMRYVLMLLTVSIFATKANAQAVCQSDGRCDDCDVGECKVVLQMNISPGLYSYDTNPSCMSGVNGASDVVTTLQAGAKAYLGDYAGSLNDLMQTNEAQKFISDNIHGELGRALNGGNRATAQCRQLCVVLPSPSKANYTAFNVESAEIGGDFSKCSPGADCPIGWSKWAAEPDQAETSSTQVVCGTFMNWSHNRTRAAKLSAYFKPNNKWVRQK